jgi:hypothetical protein
MVALAIGRDLSTITRYQACSTVASAAETLAAAPVARRSCECHGAALGVTSCRYSAGRTGPAAAMKLQEQVLVIAEWLAEVETAAAKELTGAAAVVVRPTSPEVLQRH